MSNKGPKGAYIYTPHLLTHLRCSSALFRIYFFLSVDWRMDHYPTLATIRENTEK